MKQEYRIGTLLLVYLFAIFIGASLLGGGPGDQQWPMLARAFLAGKTFFLQSPASVNDAVFWGSHYYWPFPPFPAVLILPFVAVTDFFKLPFSMACFQLLLVALAFALVYRLARKFFSPDDSAWFAIAFSFASAFLWITPVAAYTHVSYVVSVCALFAALLEYTGKKRWWLIGLLMAIALASRTTAGLGILFFLGDIFIVEKIAVRKKIKSALQLLTPFLAAILLLAYYNYARFGNPFETGYALQILLNKPFAQARAYGLFSAIHIPGNLYYFLLAAPIPIFKDGISHVLAFPYIKADQWGMGIFFVSPYFIYLFLLSYKDKISRLLIAISVLIAIPIFMYYGIGFTQLGYRYALDFLPFVYFLFMRNYSAQRGALSPRLKGLIAASALFDLFLVLTIIAYPALP